MNLERVHAMLNDGKIGEVLYNDKPVWIQEVHDNIARVSFIDTFEEKDVYVEDLYEKGLYEN